MKRKIISIGIVGCLLLVGLLSASVIGMDIRTIDNITPEKWESKRFQEKNLVEKYIIFDLSDTSLGVQNDLESLLLDLSNQDEFNIETISAILEYVGDDVIANINLQCGQYLDFELDNILLAQIVANDEVQDMTSGIFIDCVILGAKFVIVGAVFYFWGFLESCFFYQYHKGPIWDLIQEKIDYWTDPFCEIGNEFLEKCIYGAAKSDIKITYDMIINMLSGESIDTPADCGCSRTQPLPEPTDETADLVPPKNIGISFENPGILKVNIQITNRGKSFVLRSSDVIARLEYDGKIVGDCESYMFLWPFGLMVSRQLYITQPEKSGWYTFKVIVNPDGDIQNEYHDNNIQSYKKYILGTDKSRTLPRPEPTCGKPDIIVDNIEMPDGPFKVGERVDVTVTIKNDAATATDETFYVNVYTSGQIAPADIETVDGLRAYKTHKYSFSFYALATLGNGYLRVESDKGNYVNEQNELNNQKTVTFVVGKSRSVDSVFYRLIMGFPFLQQFFDLRQI